MFVYVVMCALMLCASAFQLTGANLVYGPYESEWWAANVQQRKAIHILGGQFRIPYMFNAGPFTDLTLSTFLTILKGAYSYYTLLTKGK